MAGGESVAVSQVVRAPFSWSLITHHVEQHTAGQFENIQTWVKQVTGLWGNVDGERTRCPRCKGSGLNVHKAPMFGWKKVAPSEEACWFCEGVGVMPIVGLNGFVLARCAPVLSTRDMKPRPRLPIRVQLYLGKFPGTRCKIGFHRPSVELADMLHDPLRLPAWIEADIDVGALLGSPSASKFAADAGSDRSLAIVRDRSGNTPKMARTPSSYRGPRQQWSTGRTPSSWRSSHAKATPGFAQHPKLPRSPRTPSRSPSMSRATPAESVTKVHDMRRSPLSSPRTPIAPSPRGHGPSIPASPGSMKSITPVHNASRPASPSTGGSYRRGMDLELGSPLRPTPLISSPRSARSPRKERNRIREKAEKEAMERARRIQLASRNDYALSKPPDGNQDSKWYLKAGEWLHKSRSKVPSSPASSSAPSSSTFQYKDIPWINNLVYGKLKENVKNVLNNSKAATKTA